MLVDINHAEEDDLKQVPGLTEDLAKTLVQHRPFQSWDEVAQAPGFSEDLCEKLRLSGAMLG